MKVVSLLAIVLMIAGCNEKVPQNIDLTKFLPEGNATNFHYRTTMVNEPSHSEFVEKDLLTENIVVSRKDNCIDMEMYTHFNKWEIEQMPPDMKKHIKDNRLKSENETLCADDEKLTSSGYVFYKKDGDWGNRAESTDVNGTVLDVMSGECYFVALTKEIIFGKQREVIHTNCTYSGNNIETETDGFIAEGLGVYKSVLKSDIKFDDIENHSVMTMILEQYK